MDFSNLDARGGAEVSSRMTIRHPITGKPITHDGKPCYVLVKGAHARSVQQVAQEAARAQMLRDMEAGEEEKETFHESMIRFGLLVVEGFENVVFDGKPATKDDARRFLDLFMSVPGERDPGSFAQQVVTFANEVANFLPKASAD